MTGWSKTDRWLTITAVAFLILMVDSHATPAQDQSDIVNSGTVGLIIDSAQSSDAVIASDMVTALNDGYAMRILPILGQGSMRHIEDLLYLRGVDVAMVQADVLDFYRQTAAIADVEERIRYIAKLANEEVHIIARRDITSLGDLNGRRVNFGVDGSGSFLTAGILFDHLRVNVNVTSFTIPIAMKELEEGTIDAMVIVGAAPLNALGLLNGGGNLHLLPVPTDGLTDRYAAVSLSSDDYPTLLTPNESIETIAVAKVLVSYNWPEAHPRGEKVNKFVDALFNNISKLARPPFHPKWREVDLLAPMPGWQRLPVVETLVAETK